MIVLYPIHQILFLMFAYHPFSSMTRVFLRLYAPLTTIKLMVMMICYKVIKNVRLFPCKISFNNFQELTFPKNWKKSNVVPIHKKGDKQLLQSYRPISLLPLCRKFAKELSSTQCLNLLSYYPFFMTFMLVLIKILPLKWEQTSYIYPKNLIKYSMRVCHSSLNVLEYQKTS